MAATRSVQTARDPSGGWGDVWRRADIGQARSWTPVDRATGSGGWLRKPADGTKNSAPPSRTRRLMVTCDGARCQPRADRQPGRAGRPAGHQLTYPVGWAAALGERKRAAIGQVPPDTWLIAIGTHGEVRERPADDACPDTCCGHRRCWIEEAHVAQLTLFEAVDGWRYSLWVTNLPARTPGWRGQSAYIDAAHRVPRNTPPRARPVLRPGRRGPGTAARHPGHDDPPRPPLVPVRAPLRVVPAPPVRTPHPRDTIGTRVLNRTASRQS